MEDFFHVSWILERCDNLTSVQKSGSIQFTWQQNMTMIWYQNQFTRLEILVQNLNAKEKKKNVLGQGRR